MTLEARHLRKIVVCGTIAPGGDEPMTEMTKRERLQATIRGKLADRPPVALWRHFPGDDQDPVDLAASTVAFQRLCQW